MHTYIYGIGIICVALCVWIGYSIHSVHVPVLSYEVVDVADGYEVRAYEAYVAIETRVSAPYDEAIQEGFERVHAYVNGDNEDGETFSMTRPVLIEREYAQSYAGGYDTARDVQETYRIAFVLSDRSIDTVPAPNDVRIRLRLIPPRNVIADTFFFSFGHVFNGKAEAFAEQAQGVDVDRVIYARMKAPWTFPFTEQDELWGISE